MALDRSTAVKATVKLIMENANPIPRHLTSQSAAGLLKEPVPVATGGVVRHTTMPFARRMLALMHLCNTVSTAMGLVVARSGRHTPKLRKDELANS